jgi:transcriptional regulator with XRE-family HTH domain
LPFYARCYIFLCEEREAIAILGGMTLDQLLERHSIRQPADLAAVLNISRAYAWQLMHGRRKFTADQAVRLYEEKGVPIYELLRAQIDPKPAPRGRPRKRTDET